MKELAFNGRHLPATVFITVQYLTSLSPAVRSNADIVFAMRENNMGSRKKLHESFFGGFQYYSSFASVLDSCTRNYSALVFDSIASKTSDSPIGGVFHYKGSLEPVSRLFKDEFWQYQRKYLKNEGRKGGYKEQQNETEKKKKKHWKRCYSHIGLVLCIEKQIYTERSSTIALAKIRETMFYYCNSSII